MKNECLKAPRLGIVLTPAFPTLGRLVWGDFLEFEVTWVID